MNRRAFISLLGGAVAWPLEAHAQQRERMRRVGVLMHLAADDPEGQSRVAALLAARASAAAELEIARCERAISQGSRRAGPCNRAEDAGGDHQSA